MLFLAFELIKTVIMQKFFSIIILFSMNISFSQKHLRTDSKANKINITDWIINTPKDKNLNNKYIVLNFWSIAKNDQHGYDFVAKFNGLREKFNRNDLYFITITDEKVTDVKNYFNDIDFNSIVVSDQKKITQTLYGSKDGTIFIPLTILIDKNRMIKWIGTPYMLDEKIMQDFITNQLVSYNMFVKPK
jgi:hypothetical protein